VEHALIARELGDRLALAVSACRMAVALVRSGHPELAIQLVASADAVQASLGSNIPWVAKDNQETDRLARAQLGDASVAAARDAGSRLPMEDAVDIALERVTDLIRQGTNRST
jgi:hypothetical protein